MRNNCTDIGPIMAYNTIHFISVYVIKYLFFAEIEESVSVLGRI